MAEFQPEYQERLAKAVNQKSRLFPFGRGILRVLKIAFRNLFRKHIVIEYPHVKYDLPPRARYAVRMKYDKDGAHKCTACLICQNTCPDYIIRIDVETGEDRSKFIRRWEYQQGSCMMCGLCVESCPFDAIRMSHEYELAHADPALLSIDLLENVAAARRPQRQAPPASADANAADVRGPGSAQTRAEAASELIDNEGLAASAVKSSGLERGEGYA
jgi:NADH-quinone oxidoreductase subunit I